MQQPFIQHQLRIKLTEGHSTAGMAGPLAGANEQFAGKQARGLIAAGLPVTWAWWAARALATQQRVLAGRAASLRAPLLQLMQQVDKSIFKPIVQNPTIRNHPSQKYSRACSPGARVAAATAAGAHAAGGTTCLCLRAT